MAFLTENAFPAPSWLANDAVTRRFETHGTVISLVQTQDWVLAHLLSKRRMQALVEAGHSGAANGDDYTLAAMLQDLREGIWSELTLRRVAIPAHRQEIQVSHVHLLAHLIEQNAAGRREDRLSEYALSVLSSDLATLRHDIETALKKVRDSVSRAHLTRVLSRVSDVEGNR